MRIMENSRTGKPTIRQIERQFHTKKKLNNRVTEFPFKYSCNYLKEKKRGKKTLYVSFGQYAVNLDGKMTPAWCMRLATDGNITM